MRKKKTIMTKVLKVKSKEELEREDQVYEQYYEEQRQEREQNKIADKVIEKLILKEKGGVKTEEIPPEEVIENIQKRG